jgi:hypothetical protein
MVLLSVGKEPKALALLAPLGKISQDVFTDIFWSSAPLPLSLNKCRQFWAFWRSEITQIRQFICACPLCPPQENIIGGVGGFKNQTQISLNSFSR